MMKWYTGRSQEEVGKDRSKSWERVFTIEDNADFFNCEEFSGFRGGG